MTAAAARQAGEGWRLSKGRSKRKIDAAIALVMLVDRATARVEKPRARPVLGSHMSGRSGCVVPAGMLFVPPKWAHLLVALLDDTPTWFRRRGMPMPDDLKSWLLDLRDCADRELAEGPRNPNRRRGST